MFKNKKVLVTGSEGLIGKELIIQLLDRGARIFKLDISDPKHPYDITWRPACDSFCMEVDYVFHLFGIKGSPKMTNERPVDFMGPMLQGDTNMILASQKNKVKKFLYTSSIAVENPETDKYPAWAKQTAETLIEAMRIQYPKGTEYCIVRPANVYGRFDDMKRQDPMVVTNLVRSALKEDTVNLFNTGEDIRDLINAKDVARGMIKAMEEMPTKPVNLCSGKGVSIRHLADIIGNELNKKVVTGKRTIPTKRVMALNWDFKPEISLEKGIKEVIKHAKD